MELSENQSKDLIHRDEDMRYIMIMISQIMLIDTKKAAEFLDIYNKDILESENDTKVYGKVVDLKLSIEEYMKLTGNNLQASNLEKDLALVYSKCSQLSTSDLKNALIIYRKKYEEHKGIDIKNRVKLMDLFSKLQFELISRTLREDPNTNLEELIGPDDINGLILEVIRRVDTIPLTDKSINTKLKVEKIKDMVIKDKSLYSIDVWSLLEELRTGRSLAPQMLSGSEKEKETTEKTNLPVPVKAKNSFIERISNALQGLSFLRFPLKKSDMQTLTLRELRHINIEKLSQYVSADILKEFEAKRLNDEGRTIFAADFVPFVPNAKAPIYQLLSMDGKILKAKYSYIDGDLEKKLIIKSESNQIEVKSGSFSKEKLGGDFYWSAKLINIINYANFLDRIFGTTYSNDFMCECDHTEKYKWYYDEESLKSKRKNPLLYTLTVSYGNLLKEYEKTYLEFGAMEDKRRNAHYRTTSNTLIDTSKLTSSATKSKSSPIRKGVIGSSQQLLHSDTVEKGEEK